MAENRLLHCSFCGKNQHEVEAMIASPSAQICDHCVDLCSGFIAEFREKKKEVKDEQPTELG